MTLAELIIKAKECNNMFSTAWVPLKLDGQDVDISFEPEGSNYTGWVVNIKVEKK